jgi:hypothetical protein
MRGAKGKVDSGAAAGIAFRAVSAWLQGTRRNVLVALTVVAILAVAAGQAWQQYGASEAHSEAYLVGLAQIDVNPPPPWVHGDVKREAIRLGSLEQLSLLDRNATQRVSQAFALHPWVSDVRRVSKHFPASVEVNVVYRKPVAIVEVEYGGEPGLLPIDRSATLLRPEDFSTAQVKALPRIYVGRTFPVGSVGATWGDDRVAAAALVAELLCDEWEALQLHRIEALPSIAGGLQELTAFEIVANNGRRFVWGRAPGREASGERTSDAKRAALLEALKNDYS